MLESVRHYEKRPNVDESRGRPRRWPRESVAELANNLRDILERKTEGRISTSTFVSMYLPILRYPTDVASALRESEINILEASYLAQLTPERLKCASKEARQIRAEILKAHLLTKGSQERLRKRVTTALGGSSEKVPSPDKSGKQKADELIKENPYDARHLFYEEIQQLTEAMREIEPQDLKSKTLNEFLRQIDRLLGMLRRASRKS
jgi:FKBP-type peptidyl-prolyl cis-trans isomerase (trigger factor)